MRIGDTSSLASLQVPTADEEPADCSIERISERRSQARRSIVERNVHPREVPAQGEPGTASWLTVVRRWRYFRDRRRSCSGSLIA
jgi:hypothetical protein